ncbi:MAG: biotin/lipoyl-containing protein [Bdellovibrionales bacterium]
MIPAGLKWLEMEFQGRIIRVPALKSQGRLWFHFRGETHVVELNQGSRRAADGRAKSHPGVTQAPMPGKVTRVAVKAGDSVSKGQVLVVMEAMKMEYTLAADVDGKVQDVHAREGQQVMLGEVLVKLAAATMSTGES